MMGQRKFAIFARGGRTRNGFIFSAI